MKNKMFEVSLTNKEVICIERAFDWYALKAKDTKKDKKITKELLTFFRSIGRDAAKA